MNLGFKEYPFFTFFYILMFVWFFPWISVKRECFGRNWDEAFFGTQRDYYKKHVKWILIWSLGFYPLTPMAWGYGKPLNLVYNYVALNFLDKDYMNGGFEEGDSEKIYYIYYVKKGGDDFGVLSEQIRKENWKAEYLEKMKVVPGADGHYYMMIDREQLIKINIKRGFFLDKIIFQSNDSAFERQREAWEQLQEFQEQKEGLNGSD